MNVCKMDNLKLVKESCETEVYLSKFNEVIYITTAVMYVTEVSLCISDIQTDFIVLGMATVHLFRTAPLLELLEFSLLVQTLSYSLTRGGMDLACLWKLCFSVC